jgi:transcriptional regulator with XRE-family HTH domain
MKTTIEYLDAVKDKIGISSDYALAKKLGFSLSAVSSYRCGRRVFDDDAALTVAQFLGINPLIVIAESNAERAKTPEMRDRWMDVIQGFRALLLHAKSGKGFSPTW